MKEEEKYLETDAGTADVGYPVFDAIDGLVAQETIERGEGTEAKYGEAGLDEFDELENGGDKMLERGGIGKVVGGNEAILGGVAWVLEGEGTAAAAAHAEEVYVGIEVVTNLGKVARGDVDDGVV